MECIRHWDDVNHGNQGNNLWRCHVGRCDSDGLASYLCHKLGRCYGCRVCLVSDHGGGGGDDAGEGVPRGLSDVCKEPQSALGLGGSR